MEGKIMNIYEKLVKSKKEIKGGIIMGWIWKGTQDMDMERYIAIKDEIQAFEEERITNNIMDYYRYHELYRLLYKLQAKLRKEGLL